MQKKVDDIREKFNKNVSIEYYIFTSIFIIGVLFFLSSNVIFNEDFNLMTSELNKDFYINNVSFTLKDRKYNPDTGLVQFTLKSKNNSSEFNKKDFDFEIREKKNPTELVDYELFKITNSDYIITTQIDYKWEALSLTIREKTIEEVTQNSIKFYSDIRDIDINNELRKKSLNEYTVEVIDTEIKDITSNMNEITSSIESKKVKIENLKENIKSLEEDKKYQTESELEVTNNTIASNNTSIINLENEIKSSEEKLIELKEKIEKLEGKKSEFK